MLSLLPTLGDQLLHEMNVEQSWAKLQESRKQEKALEKRKADQAARRQERLLRKAAKAEAAKAAATVDEEPEPIADNNDDANDDGSKEIDHDNDSNQEERPTEEQQGKETPALDFSVGSISDSVATSDSMVVVEEEDSDDDDEEEDEPIPEGLLDKQAKYLLWEDIKVTSKSFSLLITVDSLVPFSSRLYSYAGIDLFHHSFNPLDSCAIEPFGPLHLCMVGVDPQQKRTHHPTAT